MTPAQERLIQVLAAATLVALIGGSITIYRLREGPPIDDRYCLTDQSPPAHVVVLVDRTDNLTEAQKQLVDTFIQRISLDRNSDVKLSRYSRLSLYSFETNGANQLQLDLLFSFCKPSAESDANVIYETPELVQRAFEATFGSTLLQSTSTLTDSNTSPYSYILDAILDVSEGASFDLNQPNRTLIIFSDMLQNSPAFSQYSRQSSPNRYRASDLISDNPALSTSDPLAGVAVRVIYLPRDNGTRIQGSEHRRFWTDLFYLLGATSVTFERGPR